jgi:phosphatidate cytidylyltransferase
VTDRFDCQMPMAVFAYLYYHMYIAADQSEGELVDRFLDLPLYTKLKVFGKLGSVLVADGLVSGELLERLMTGAQAAAQDSMFKECSAPSS